MNLKTITYVNLNREGGVAELRIPCPAVSSNFHSSNFQLKTMNLKCRLQVKWVLLPLLIAAVFTGVEAQSQTQRVIKGSVKDQAGMPVVGASIVIEGTAAGTTSGVDGEFALNLPAQTAADAVVTASFLGYKPFRAVLGTNTYFNIILAEDAEHIEDVVVTALGIKRSEKALSYNVQTVKNDAITTVKDANFMNSLVGKVAGVSINSGANGPGGAARVVMRGAKSLTGSNLALYVIDGIPMYNMINSSSGAIMSDQPGTDGVADLNPDDIETISMLTGPSAAALYGNAAANGVVLITTKRGQADKTVVSVSNSTTFSRVYKMPAMQGKYGNLPGEVKSWGSVVNNDYDPAGFFNTGVNTMSTVSLSTGNQRNQFYASASSTNTSGVLPNNDYDRYNFTIRGTTKFAKDKLTLDAGASYIKQYDKNMVSQGIYYNPLPGLYLFPRSDDFNDVRMFERYDEALGYKTTYWPYGNNQLGMQNPYWVQNREIRENNKKRYMLNGSLTWQITDWLNVKGRVSIDNNSNRLTYKLYASTDRIWAGKNGAYTESVSSYNNTYADAIATVNKTFGDWSVNINLGASLNDTKNELLGYAGGLGDIPNFFTVRNLLFSESWKVRQYGWHDQSQAIFANAEIGWRDMLYLTLTGRNDWESQLAYSDYTSFFYPSVGLSAVVTNMFKAPDWLTYLKVRGSYTEVGNSYGRFMTTITYPFDEQATYWGSSTSYPNLKLKPERTKSWEAGFNARLLKHINLDFTYYRSHTYNQTFYASLSSSSGFSDTPIQSGDVMNQGVEMALGYSNQWGDFAFSTNYTLTWNENKVVTLTDGVYNFVTGEPYELPELEKSGFGGLDAKIILREGGSMGDVYAEHVLARDLNGNILYDVNKGLSTTQKRTYLGSILPKTTMGWSNHFSYKGLDLGLTFSARIGGICLSETESHLDNYGISERSARARDAGGVKINNGHVSAQHYYQTISGLAGYYTYSATNVRLNELSLNYTLPAKWFRNKMRMTIGVVGKNLWMIYCKAPFDPELSAEVSSSYYNSFDCFMMPSTRNFGFNVKLQF